MKKILLFMLLLGCQMGFAQNHWTPDISPYPDYMRMHVVVQCYGVDMASSFLEIGAFCGDECRGSVMVGYCPPLQRYVFYLPVYGNDGETFRFKLYDHQQGKELESLVTDELPYNYDGYGVGDDPYLMNFVSGESSGSQPGGHVSIELTPGWNWISNLLTTDTELEKALVNLTPNNGDMIKSQNSFSTFNAADGRWDGALSSMTPGKGYIYLRNGETTSFSYPAEENSGGTSNVPFVTMDYPPLDVSAHDAMISFTVLSTDDTPVIVRGVCWGIDPDPRVEGDHTFDGYGEGTYTSYLTDLMPNTNYFVRGYAVTPNGVGYSDLVSFTTLIHLVTVYYSCNEVCGAIQASAVGTTYTNGHPCELMAGQTCTLTAIPNPGYSFYGWYIGDELVSTDASYTFTVYDDTTIVAYFSEIEYTITTAWTPDTLMEPIFVSPNQAFVGQTVEIQYAHPEGLILTNLRAKKSNNVMVSFIINDGYCTMQMPADNVTVTGTYQEIVVGDIEDIHQHETLYGDPYVTNVGFPTRVYVFYDPQGEMHSMTLDELMAYTFDIVGKWYYYVRYQNQYGYFITETKHFQVLP